MADIRNPENGHRQNVRMLLDSGSQRTYITESLARRSNLKMGNRGDIMLVTFGSEKPTRIRSPTTKLDIRLKDGSTLQISANVVPQIAGSIQRRPVNLKSFQNWEYLWGEFPLADDLPKETETSSVELLIGNDYYLDIILPQKIEVQTGLYMLGSKLGWILSGRTSENVSNIPETGMLILTYGNEIQRESSMLTQADKSPPLKPNMEDFWNMESIGINDCPVELDDNITLNKFKETLRYENGRYTVAWPWKDEKPDLPENRALALGRLKSLIRRTKDNPDLLQKYDEIIEDQLKQGAVEKVRMESKDTIKHYILHHAVINPTKATTKVRIAYDDTDYSPETTSSDRLVALWKKGLKHLDSFWRIWRDDYLLSMRERSQRKLKERRTQSPFNANVGDVVLVKDDLPRGMWRFGHIYELIESRDGRIRSAKVLLHSKKTIGRPLCSLYPIECLETDDTDTNCPNRNFDDQTNGGQNNEPDHGATNVIRPKRLAASIAKQRISEQLRDSYIISWRDCRRVLRMNHNSVLSVFLIMYVYVYVEMVNNLHLLKLLKSN